MFEEFFPESGNLQITKYPTYADFPSVGDVDLLYYEESTGTFYVWDGSAYEEAGQYPSVDYFADLPTLPDSQYDDKIYRVRFESGSRFLFNYHPSGFYSNDGTTWDSTPMVAGALTTGDVINNLTSTVTNLPLSANQGRILKELLASDYVPYTGANTHLSLGAFNITAANFSGSSSGTNTGDQDLSSYTLGAASSTDLAIAIFDGTSGKQIKNSLATVGSDGTLTSKGILVDGNQNSSVNIICSNADTTDASSRARIVANALHPVLGMIGNTNPYGLHLDPDDSYNLKEIFSSVTISSPFRVVDRSTSATTLPLQPAFRAYNSTFRTDATGTGETYQIICNTALINVGSSYSTSTGVFTAPISGTYLFTAGVGLGGINTTSNTLLTFGLQSTDAFLEITELNVNSTTMTVSGSFIVDMDAGETIYPTVQVNGSVKGVDVRNAARITNFAGFLLG